MTKKSANIANQKRVAYAYLAGDCDPNKRISYCERQFYNIIEEKYGINLVEECDISRINSSRIYSKKETNSIDMIKNYVSIYKSGKELELSNEVINSIIETNQETLTNRNVASTLKLLKKIIIAYDLDKDKIAQYFLQDKTILNFPQRIKANLAIYSLIGQDKETLENKTEILTHDPEDLYAIIQHMIQSLTNPKINRSEYSSKLQDLDKLKEEYPLDDNIKKEVIKLYTEKVDEDYYNKLDKIVRTRK